MTLQILVLAAVSGATGFVCGYVQGWWRGYRDMVDIYDTDGATP